MANLLEIYRDVCDLDLESLAKDWVEGFFDVNKHHYKRQDQLGADF